MKKLTLLFLILPFFGFSQREVKTFYDPDRKQMLKERFHVKRTEPDVRVGEYEKYHPSGGIMMTGNYIDGFPNGNFKEYYESGKLQRIIPYKDGIRDGKLIIYDEYGNEIQTGTFINGQLNDSVFLYYPSGKLKSKSFFQNGKPEGLMTVLFESGNVKQKMNYEEGLQTGVTNEWYENGILKSSINYEKGIPIGFSKNYFDDGNIHTISEIKDGEKHGFYKEYDKNGLLLFEIQYASGKKNGTSKSWYPNGKIRYEYHYKNDQKTGINITYNENGVPILKEELLKDDVMKTTLFENGSKTLEKMTKNNIPVEIWKYFYTNNKLKREENYDKGKLHGEYVLYDSVGQVKESGLYQYGYIQGQVLNYYSGEGKNIKSKTEYRMGTKTGTYREYDKKGKLTLEGNFKNNVREGLWSVYNKSGDLIEIQVYKNGILTESRAPDEEGKKSNEKG